MGSAPRTQPYYRNPGLLNEDAVLSKNFNVTEHKYVQLRLEAYNVTNSPQWGKPNVSFGSTSFGQINIDKIAPTIEASAKLKLQDGKLTGTFIGRERDGGAE